MSYYYGSAQARASAALAPGAMPAFGAIGTATSTATVAGTHALVYPATVGAGDLVYIVAWAMEQSDGIDAMALHADAVSVGFVEIAGSPFKKTGDGANDYWILIARKTAVGDEDSTTLTNAVTVTCNTTTADGLHGLMFNLTAANGFAATPEEGFGTQTEVFNAQTMNAPGVTPTDVNRLGLSILGLSNDPTGLAAWAGASPDTWAVAALSQTTSGGGMTIQIQEIDLSSGDPVSGGSETWSGNASGFAVGFAVAPADV
jgi:hypothetical protein